MPFRPVEFGDQLASTLRVYKDRLGTFVLITLVPYLLSAVIFAIAALSVLGIGFGWLTTLPNNRPPDFSSILGIMIRVLAVMLAASAASWIVSARFAGMRAVLTGYAIGHSDRGRTGPAPTFRDAWRGSSGFVSRILPLYLMLLAIAAVTLLAYSVIGATVTASKIGQFRTGSSWDLPQQLLAALAALLGVYLAFFLVLLAPYVIIRTRLYPLVPVVALERRGGLKALGRAWTLTRGYGLRTFGYSYLAGLIINVIINLVCYLVVGIESSLIGAALTRDVRSTTGLDPALLVAGGLLFYLPVIAAAVLTTPFTGIFQTVYTIDLQRRERFGIRPGQRLSAAGRPDRR